MLNQGRKKSTFLFIPGGPGMTPGCFEKFANQYLNDYKVLGLTFNGNQTPNIQSWANDLELALRIHPVNIIIGHSFGGMLALSSKRYQKYIDGQILLNSAPNMSWTQNLSLFKMSPQQKTKIPLASIYFDYFSYALHFWRY
jgi:predicted alpha/beta hydrolase family esterase